MLQLQAAAVACNAEKEPDEPHNPIDDDYKHDFTDDDLLYNFDDDDEHFTGDNDGDVTEEVTNVEIRTAIGAITS